MLDQHGENEKPRFNLVIRLEAGFCYALGISTSVNFNDLSEYQIELPYNSDGGCKTGLKERSAVCCDWINKIDLAECKHCGFVPGKLMPPIIDRVNEYAAKHSLPVAFR